MSEIESRSHAESFASRFEADKLHRVTATSVDLIRGRRTIYQHLPVIVARSPLSTLTEPSPALTNMRWCKSIGELTHLFEPL